ncbi:HsdS, type I restriction-modification system, S subunit [Nitratireductor basaltis]|uniref:HsdS, type I restriction-modification system, S subunit n=2 Tax=Nitratireductor basaltis TaxID=472175 RepID=A0A084UC04_9HYPH|nr:HsdS, type I restriction-modification system, S subunit [Nitratireductor basaltis]
MGGGAVSVPERRFPDFHEAGAWKSVSLGSVASISTKKVGNKTCIPMSITSGVGLVSQMEKFGRIIAGESYKNYLLLQKNDFAYNKSATKEFPEGFISLYSGEELAAVPNSIFTCFRVKEDAVSPSYLNYLFLGNLHGRWLRRFIEVGARAHGSLSINDRDLLALPVPVPAGPNSLREQQKIADCLDSADALITAQGRKVEALKAHKKGLMQQLFPQEGETQPRLRFPEFRDADDWKEVTLAKFIEEFREQSTVQDEYEVMTSARSGLVRQREYYDNDRITERDNVGFNVIPPNYMTYRSRSDNRKFYFNENKLGVTGIVSIYYPVFRILNGSNKFFIELFSMFSRIIGMYSVGTSQTVLSFNQLKKIKLPVPGEAEQQRIADCLASLDDLIAAEARKLDALKTHKKGLMQQLFPSVAVGDA